MVLKESGKIRRQKKSERTFVRKVDQQYFVSWMVLVFIWVVSLYFLSPLGLIWNLLLGVQGADVTLMAVDKWASSRNKSRVPERVLFILAFLGGSPAILLSMWLFKHKTSKVSFQFWFAVAVVLQILIVAGAWWVVKNDATNVLF